METQNTFTTVLENESVTVNALLCAEILKIKVKVTDSANEHFGQTFVTEITEQERKEKLKDYFESLEETFEFLENDKLIKVDLEQRKMILWELTKFKRQIPFFTTKLIKEEKQNEEILSQHLSQVINRCLEKSEIGNDQIKRYFEIIANEMIILKKQKVNKNQQKRIKNQFYIQKELLMKIEEQKQKDQSKNEKLSERLDKLVNKIRKMQEKISLQNEKIRTLETKINEKSEKIYNLENNLCAQSEKISKEIDFYAQKLKKEMGELQIKNNETVEQRLVHLENNMKYLDNIIKKQQQRQQKKLKQKEKQSILMQKHQFMQNPKSFEFDGKTLKKIKDHFFNIFNETYTIFPFFQEISLDSQFTFNVKIRKKFKYPIYIGVIDYEDYTKNGQNQNNNVSYFLHGNKYPKQQIKLENKFKNGDFVTVKVDRNKKTIQWLINNKLQSTANKQFFGDKNRKLFPFVQLSEPGEVIQFTF